MSKLIYALSFLIALFVQPAVYARGPGTTSADFLVIYSDARPAALGGAYTALADDAAGMDFNPAGLVQAPFREFSAGYIAWFEDASFQHLTYTHPFANMPWAWGASLLYFDGGEFMATNELGLAIGERITVRDISASVGAARNFGRFLSVGLSAKYVGRKLERYSADAFAGDIGLLYRTPIENLTFGASILNIGSRLKFISDKEDLPLTFRTGIAWKTWLDNLTLTADAIKVIDEPVRVGIGAEADIVHSLKLRAGWRNDDTLQKGYSFGAGFTVMKMVLDYAYVPFDELGATHRVTGSIMFGGPTKPEVNRVPWDSVNYQERPVEPSPTYIEPQPKVSGTE